MNKILFEDLRLAFVKRDLALLKDYAQQVILYLKSTQYLHDKTFLHPLGFFYSKLYEFENNETIRIHIWDNRRYMLKPEMNIHNHYYTVNSYIYKGCVDNTIYSINSVGGLRYALFEGAYSQNADRILRRTNKTIDITLDYNETHCEGTLYQITTDQLHSGKQKNEMLTCTIVYTEKPGKPNPLVLGPIKGPEEYFHTNELASNHLVDELLNDILLS